MWKLAIVFPRSPETYTALPRPSRFSVTAASPLNGVRPRRQRRAADGHHRLSAGLRFEQPRPQPRLPPRRVVQVVVDVATLARQQPLDRAVDIALEIQQPLCPAPLAFALGRQRPPLLAPVLLLAVAAVAGLGEEARAVQEQAVNPAGAQVRNQREHPVAPR
jgi:hypothetical protein